jgi:hypothetical protein
MYMRISYISQLSRIIKLVLYLICILLALIVCRIRDFASLFKHLILRAKFDQGLHFGYLVLPDFAKFVLSRLGSTYKYLLILLILCCVFQFLEKRKGMKTGLFFNK